MTHRLYDEDFKKSIVALYQNGKNQSQLSKEYDVSLSAIGKWIRLYSEVKTVDGDIMTAKQIKDLQRRNAQLEEENLILKKAIAIYSNVALCLLDFLPTMFHYLYKIRQEQPVVCR